MAMQDKHFFTNGDEAIHLHSENGTAYELSVGNDGALTVKNEETGAVIPGGAGSGLPTGGAAHQQLVTDADGNATWEDRTHWKEIINKEVIPVTDLIRTDSSFVLTTAPTNLPVIGINHTVVIDGVSFESTARLYEEDGMTGYVLGNPVAMGGENDNQPYVFVIFSPEAAAEAGAYGLFVFISDAGDYPESVPVSVTVNGEGYYPLDEKYIPDSVKSANTNLVNGRAKGSLQSFDASEEHEFYTLGEHSVAYGAYAAAHGACSLAFGNNAEAGSLGNVHGAYSGIAIGTNATATGEDAVAVGFGTHAEGHHSVCLGNGRAVGDYAFASGQGVYAAGEHSTVFGRFNKRDTENKYAFIIGNGVAGEGIMNGNSNAHTLDWDGNAWYQGYVEGTKLILPSPNGTRWAITVGDDGTLSAAAVTE